MLNTILDVDCIPHEMEDLYSTVLMLVVQKKTRYNKFTNVSLTLIYLLIK